ncbi:MAG: CopG family transcriptional regulator [Candidatus Heimdallarchaeota archaeon]|nr:CopG family transcriptional regulator [Candidatus Heimdallarchaeota archaeon]MCK4954585.1 CopG family transcriptional regulator [Candidatus Heimdallarchaeota archaeon]
MDGQEQPVISMIDGEKIKQYEKITVNLPAVDLGKIDYLVEQGFYNTRTEFIRTSIKSEIDKNSFVFEKISKEILEDEKFIFVMGLYSISKEGLEKYLAEGKKVKVFVVGMCYLSKDIDVNLVSKTVESFKVYGIKKGPKEVMEYLKNLE